MSPRERKSKSVRSSPMDLTAVHITALLEVEELKKKVVRMERSVQRLQTWKRRSRAASSAWAGDRAFARSCTARESASP